MVVSDFIILPLVAFSKKEMVRGQVLSFSSLNDLSDNSFSNISAFGLESNDNYVELMYNINMKKFIESRKELIKMASFIPLRSLEEITKGWDIDCEYNKIFKSIGKYGVNICKV